MRKQYQVFKTQFVFVKDEAHSTYVTSAFSGVHTEEVANRYCAVLTAVSDKEAGGRPVVFEVRKVRA